MVASQCCPTIKDALANTLEQNYMLYDALVRKEARAALCHIDGYATVKAATTPDGFAAFKAHTAKLAGVINAGAPLDVVEDDVPSGYTPIEELLGSSNG